MDFEAMLEAGKSSRGSWSREQMDLIGVKWPPKQGWRRRMRGDEIDEVTAQKFVALKDAHLESTSEPTIADERMRTGAFTEEEIDYMVLLDRHKPAKMLRNIITKMRELQAK